jgi:hypothetical protein
MRGGRDVSAFHQAEEPMKTLIAGCALALALGACKDRTDDTGAASRTAADTIVTQRDVQDTSIIRHDTTVSTDTVRKRGGTVGRDTVRKH